MGILTGEVFLGDDDCTFAVYFFFMFPEMVETFVYQAAWDGRFVIPWDD